MVGRVFLKVFSQAQYIQIAASIAFIAISVAILLPNTAVLWQVFSSPAITFLAKMQFLLSVYGSLFTNFTFFSALYTVGITLLFGINSALLVYYIARRRSPNYSNVRGNTAGFFGLVSGLFGIGCAACGSVIISGLLALFGAGSLLALLPFHGAEFGLLGVILLSFSVFQLCKRIADPLVCTV
jgi:hypothetical protein